MMLLNNDKNKNNGRNMSYVKASRLYNNSRNNNKVNVNNYNPNDNANQNIEKRLFT